nr:IS701 family transposase [Protofrankia symbiont of Coriaria ruscifolia]
MTARLPCPPAPAPVETYASRFDDLFASRAQRRGFRDYLAGLLAPRDRNKTLTGLAGAEPVVGAQHREVQRLQWFLSESPGDHEKINRRRVELLQAEPATAPHPGGVLILDDSGDRKSGHATAGVARQYIGSRGGVDRGIVAVSTAWADERVYHPLHTRLYTPASRLPGGRTDPAFRTKGRLAATLVGDARTAGIGFRAVVADCFYGPSESPGLVTELRAAGVPFVLALKPHQELTRPDEDTDIRTPAQAARARVWAGPTRPGQGTPVTRVYRDGHTETWWATDCRAGPYRIGGPTRLVVATTDPATLPATSTWYLATTLPHPDLPAASAFPSAAYNEIIRLYGLRGWVEQDYKQVTHELGWADFQVRSATAITRHQTLVHCAFSLCWHDSPPSRTRLIRRPHRPRITARQPTAVLAGQPPPGPRLPDPTAPPPAGLAGLDHRPDAPPARRTHRHTRRRAPALPTSIDHRRSQIMKCRSQQTTDTSDYVRGDDLVRRRHRHLHHGSGRAVAERAESTSRRPLGSWSSRRLRSHRPGGHGKSPDSADVMHAAESNCSLRRPSDRGSLRRPGDPPPVRHMLVVLMLPWVSISGGSVAGWGVRAASGRGVQGDRAAFLRGGAPGAQRAVGAQSAERGDVAVAGGGEHGGVSGGAGDGAGGVVDAEVVGVEPAGDVRSGRPGFDDRGVPGVDHRGEQVGGAVGGVAERIDRPPDRRIGGQQGRADRAVAAALARTLGELAAGDDPVVRFGDHVRLVAVDL